jgi:hypothetical protein
VDASLSLRGRVVRAEAGQLEADLAVYGNVRGTALFEFIINFIRN